MSIDDHELRYAPLTAEIERVIVRRLFQNRLDGYVFETALELAQGAFDFHADPFLQPKPPHD